MDRLSIIGLDVWTKVGCTAEERAFPQRLEVDADLFLPLAKAGREDDLSAAVDYAAVAAAVRAALESATFRLAEAAAEKAAGVVLKRFPRVRRVDVRVRKRALPGIAFAEVVLSRTKSPGKM
jgi:FolB domain-containing protein